MDSSRTLSDPDSGVRWRFDEGFLASNWACVWGRGCVGIGDEPAEHLGHGCCSVGAQMLDDDEAMNTAALAATLDPDRFQFHDHASGSGVLTDDRSNTRVVDGACIMLNRPGFTGGAGCALHLAAVDAGEAPLEWKPSICWQLPLKVETIPADEASGSEGEGSEGESSEASGDEVRLLRRWQRQDWGPDGATMAWLCTDESNGSYVGDQPVIDSLEDELTALLGRSVYVELRASLGPLEADR